MPRQANGTYVAPANTAAVGGTTISSSAFNTLETDIGTEITNSVDRGGRSSMTAALPMGNQKITGMADPTVATDGATKNYVDTSVAAFFSTGDLKPTLKTVADTGWIMGGANATIGNTGSGATYANANALALYTLIWNNISSPTANAFCPVTGGLGASASADWAGLKPLATGWYASRGLGFAAGGGGALTTRALGSHVGTETNVIGQTNLPAVNFTVSGFVNGVSNSSTVVTGNGTTTSASGGGAPLPAGMIQSQLTTVSTFSGTQATAASGGSGTALNNMQPTFFANVMIKL